MPVPHPLDALFYPASIAIIGASSDPKKVGGRPIDYMKRSGFTGKIIPVNPTQSEVQGLPAYPSLAAIPGPVDQVIVAVAGSKVAPAVDESIAKGVKSIIVFSSGFGELNEEGKLVQEEIARRCTAAGVQLVGPNCIGVFSAERAMYATFMSAIEHDLMGAGGVGIVSQSGAIGSYLYGLAGDRGLRFSHFVATGNEAGIDVADCIEWMAQDPATKVIMAYLEGCRDGNRLRTALARAAQARKPVVVMKVGSSEQGAAAAASHTGSLAGADAIYDTVFRETNAYRARTIDEMLDVAYAASVAPLPRGNRVAVVTPSGGIGVIVADEAAQCGLTLPELPEAMQRAIKDVVPYASGVNPVDTTGQVVGDRSLFTRIMRIVCNHDGFDTLLSFNANIGKSETEFAKVSQTFFELKKAFPERLFAISMRAKPEVVASLEEAGILYFEDPARATRTIAALARIAAGFDRLLKPLARPLKKETLPVGAIDEATARDLLSSWEIPFAAQAVATCAEEAVAAADKLGYPLVLKVLSPDIAHKSDVGGVLLGLKDAQAVRNGWESMMCTVAQHCPDASIQGAVLSPMITGGVETVLGVARDPVFGPMVMFGIGGVFVEVFKDVTFRSAPLDLDAARSMIDDIRGKALLEGARGRAPADKECIAHALVALSRFAAAYEDEVESVEINPFIALSDGGCAVDALIVRRKAV